MTETERLLLLQLADLVLMLARYPREHDRITAAAERLAEARCAVDGEAVAVEQSEPTP